jgi:hypothetical protein
VNSARALIAVFTCFASLPPWASAQAVPRDLKTWTLEYSIDGGITPFHSAVTLTQAGDLTVSNFDNRVTGHASAELMTTITDFLKVAKKARPFTPGPDQRSVSLTLTSAGVTHELDVPNAIGDLLFQTMDTTMKNAFVGTWWESEWKLCHPAKQLTGEQMDPPIQSLTFSVDGHFSVTWPGGGAESPGRPGEPFIWVPDYSGRYIILSDYSGIRLVFEGGIHSPRDFSGNGNFDIDDKKLVLRNLWLGTYRAREKPGICEMTFKRINEPVPARDSTRK